MRNYVAVVFDDTGKAYEGLHALWQLDDAAEVTVHGTAVVHRDAMGNFQVDTKETHPALATGVGVGVGALLGLLAGPAGAAVGAAGGAAIGAATGGAVGVTADLVRADTRDQAAGETGFVLGAGQSAVIADVSEDWTSPIDTRMPTSVELSIGAPRAIWKTMYGSTTTSIRTSTSRAVIPRGKLGIGDRALDLARVLRGPG